jgi:major membrane immunogen (membrane-anchored lipoprotein)
MNKLSVTGFGVIAVLLLTTASLNSGNKSEKVSPPGYSCQDTVRKYRDGSYEGLSRDSYTDEPYWGLVRVKIENGLFTSIDFSIRDSNLHEKFDGAYEKHFEGNQVYIEQSRNDWNGVKTYPQKLLERQDIGKVDAVSGATWSFNIFRASLSEALKDASVH